MKTKEIKVTITNQGELLLKSPLDLPQGNYDAVLIFNEKSVNNSPELSIEKAQSLVGKHIPETRNLAQELIEQRRSEALNE